MAHLGLQAKGYIWAFGPKGTRLFGTFGSSGQRIRDFLAHLALQAKGHATFWHIWAFRPKGMRLFGTFGPSGQRVRDLFAHLGLQAKGYETFWHIWAFTLLDWSQKQFQYHTQGIPCGQKGPCGAQRAPPWGWGGGEGWGGVRRRRP